MRFGWEFKKKNRREFLTLKELGNCQTCGTEKTTDRLYSYVDGNNKAITKNSKVQCIKCYKESHKNW